MCKRLGEKEESLCNAILYHKILARCSNSMVEYYNNSSKCRLKLLMAQFLEVSDDKASAYHLCCDVCENLCNCDESKSASYVRNDVQISITF